MPTTQWTDQATLRANALRVLGSIDTPKLKPTEDDVEDAARDAIDELSKLRPDVRIHDEAGDGTTRRWVLSTTVTGWDDEKATLERLEVVTDAGANDENINAIEAADYRIQPDAAGDLVMLLDSGQVPASTETLRFVWTMPLEVADLDAATATTVDARWKQVVELLVAERLARLIARKACDQADHTMGIDQVEFRTFDRRWTERAGELRKRAEERLAPGAIGEAGVGGSVEYVTRPRLRRQRIAH